MELRDYVHILRKYWVLIVACTLLGIIVGAGASLLMTPEYEARTELYVSVRNESQTSGDLVAGSNFARQSVQSYVSIVTTESVLRPVVEELQLDDSVTDLAKRVSAEAPLNTSLVNITVSDDDPERAAEIANAIGASFTQLVQDGLEIMGAEDGASPVKLTTVQPALVPASPVSPRLALNLALGALVGLALGVAIAVLRTVLDTRVHSLHDLEQLTDAPLLGGIAFDPNAKSRPLVVHSDPKSPRAESFRTLRTNLQFLSVNEDSEQRGRSFVVSSASPGEGKSTTMANLAIALAESGATVALIDGDLRLPRVAEYMGLEGGVGLTDVLIGRAKITEVLQRWGSKRLFVLPAGKVPPNPSELLGSAAMVELMRQLHEHFDFVLIDAPPILLVTDAAVLSKLTNGTILVAASGSTRKQDLAMAVRSLAAAGGTLRGIVVTMLPTRGPNSYGYGGYGYGGYGYGSAESELDPKAPENAGRKR
ncbi:polysaccharide biosynthesis tyrosine autokinase [Leucobacter massiliensis]|uniref:non-specific protein-tyrosine kinase n=1 Tax=Leucobacter massiliensis TaxID=1686285 RepID=A0A2S9QN66_9MICO|nr:polysaccharide biosynthesis tyrosine autokinase [Leucobacter massiliensis]PRI11020.1 chromosome partitioning protein [Leucobacter massiliensis]